MPRASWNGFLRLSLVSCPVALVPATTEAKRVRFNQLNAKTGNRIQQQLIDSKTGEVVDRGEIDPVYLDKPYYVYPDGQLAADTFRVISEAMEHKTKVGMGRVTMSSREHLVLVEPRDGGLVMTTIRSADEVRPAEFGPLPKTEIDADMVAIAETIIERRSGP